MSYKPTPTAADNFDELKRFVNDQLLKIANEINKPKASSTGATVTYGTWTPAFSIPSGTLTYSHQSGNWAKIGNELFVSGKIQLSFNTASGTAQSLKITGLPEPIKSGNVGIFSFHYDTFQSLYAGLTGYVVGSEITVREQNSSGTEYPTILNTSLCEFSGNYRV